MLRHWRVQRHEVCLPAGAKKQPGKALSPAEEGYDFAVGRLRNPYTRTYDLVRAAMNGLYVYSILVAGSLLALAIWISRRYDLPLYGQVGFLFGGFMPWAVIMTGSYSPLQSSVPVAQQKANPDLVTPSDNRVFLEKRFFDAPQHYDQQPSQPVLKYAALGSDVFDDVFNNEREITSGPLLNLYSWTAVYDISAHTVYLPDGTKLEAHSGRGSRLDDPRYVYEHMRGATPPNIYELALREKTFHGVQALRLNPVDGSNTFGRAGLLAHTYMLGPKGESNGCVVFKNYSAFLRAFQNGQVKRLIVVDNLKFGEGYELTLAQASFARFADLSYWSDTMGH